MSGTSRHLDQHLGESPAVYPRLLQHVHLRNICFHLGTLSACLVSFHVGNPTCEV